MLPVGGPGDAERPLDNERLRVYAEFGAIDDDNVVELPDNVPG